MVVVPSTKPVLAVVAKLGRAGFFCWLDSIPGEFTFSLRDRGFTSVIRSRVRGFAVNHRSNVRRESFEHCSRGVSAPANSKTLQLDATQATLPPSVEGA